MRKALQFFSVVILLSFQVYAQEDRFSQLSETNVVGYAKPLATTLGMGINSASFYSANVPEFFGFSFSIRTMLISVPDDQLTFTPELPDGYAANEPSPTFWGEKGGNSYLGPNGYVSMPGGINEQSIPFGMPQIAASFMGTEVMLRFLPTIQLGEEDVNFFGIAVKHEITRYIPLLPLDIAVQVMYNKLQFSDIVEGTNLAFNAHASKTFGVFRAYSGLQYESSKFDLNYTLEGDENSGDPELRQDKKISAEVEGDNNFRFILGGAVKFSILVINADVNFGSQTVFTSGISLEF
ncbi:MAG: DUF6588 family protein [Ignavibacteriaceae bacterium]